jgi:ribosomal protein S18 acetylase RimI-like enzyme
MTDAISPGARGIAIRPATPDDFAAVGELFRVLDAFHVRARPDVFFDVPGDARPRSFYDAVLADPSQAILVAEAAGGQLAGFVHVLRKVKGGADVPGVHPLTYGLIQNLSVAPGLRSRGIGWTLMEAASAWAFERGATELEIGVHEFNERARKLYERFGFVTSVRTMRLVPGKSPGEVRGVLAGEDRPNDHDRP